MRLFLSLLTGLLIISAGCEKKCTQFDYCSIGQGSYGYPRIIGYYAADVDTQIILSFTPNGLFNQRRDSFCYINTDVTAGHITNETDTQDVEIRYTGGAYYSQQINDFKLILPGVRTYRFTEVMADGEFAKDDEFTCSNGSRGCYRRVTSMKIDGVFHDFSDFSTPLILYK